ncbi:MAG: prepilin-type N-terminal cleavage/methylation domain-containing protein [Terriglobia bacterium]
MMLNDLMAPRVDSYPRKPASRLQRGRSSSGFTLIEMLVGIVLMMVLGGMVFSLFNKHAVVYKLQQEVTELNLGLRSGLELISADLLNSGANLSLGGSQRFPVPVIVKKNDNGNFDSITVYQGYKETDTNNYLPPLTLTTADGTDPGAPFRIDNISNLYVNPAPGKTAAETAAQLTSGTYVVIVNTDTNDLVNYGQIAPVTLTADSVTAGAGVRVQITKVGTNDHRTIDSGLTAFSRLGTFFRCGAMVVKLAPPVIYWVDTTDPLRPALERTTRTSASNSTLQLASNILSFSQRARVAGVMKSNPAADYGNDFSLIEALEVTIAGRTASDRIDRYQSGIDPTKTFRLNSLTTVVALRNKVN